MKNREEIRRAQDLRLRKDRLLQELRAQNEELAELCDGVDIGAAELSDEQCATLGTLFDTAIEAPVPSRSPEPVIHLLAFAARA